MVVNLGITVCKLCIDCDVTGFHSGSFTFVQSFQSSANHSHKLHVNLFLISRGSAT